MIKLVVFDLDNVIIDGEAIDEIGKLANVEEEIAEITEKAMQGEIDFETSIKDRVKLLEGTSMEDIQKVADELPLMMGAEESIKSLKDDDLKVAVISGSFDVVGDVIKEKLGLDYVFTNSFTVEDGKFTAAAQRPPVSAPTPAVPPAPLPAHPIPPPPPLGALTHGLTSLSRIHVLQVHKVQHKPIKESS